MKKIFAILRKEYMETRTESLVFLLIGLAAPYLVLLSFNAENEYSAKELLTAGTQTTHLKNGPTPYSLTLPSAVATLRSSGMKGSAISYGKQQPMKHARESSRVKSISARLTFI
ncbi:MAG: hypothetical protein II655_09565, partial [Thermoguttaceae bacterium]|nr:hypothetical protein [Thermoguttaceae bacterium]